MSGTRGSRVQAGAEVRLEVMCPMLLVTTHTAWLTLQESSISAD